MLGSRVTKITYWSVESRKCNIGPQMGIGTDFRTDIQERGLLEQNLNNYGCGAGIYKRFRTDYRNFIDWTRTFHNGFFHEHLGRDLFVHFSGRGAVLAGSNHE